MSKKREVIEVEATVVEVHGKTLFDRVTDYLTDKDWGFHVIEDRKCLSFGLRLRDSSVRVLVDAAENEEWSRVLVYCTYPTYVPAPRRLAVADAISRINYVNYVGNLEMDMNDGELRVRTILEGDSLIGEPMIDRAIRKSLDLADQYQAALLSIAFGNALPADVLAMASRGEDATLQ
ncbi:MAG: YbjN domain-containing protein [Rhodoferax sp.]|jgi:hypothetical protein|nr:YbjN domain-containing protein [Rhodoferax sp.]